uniref:U3 small nucleolar RNA-associated protein 11 n=1 Tax=Oncorhynchus kisutch TaxID=8019 RepID=A0A8C7GED4_ONCKI
WSSNRKVVSSNPRPGFRKHLGHLEKKKDYKLRVENRTPLLLCVKKALDKNPYEFYFKMVSSQLKDGVHASNKAKGTEEENTEEQRKLMRTQDIRYVEMKRVAEGKKIERLKSELHLLDADGKRALADFDLASHLDTAPELVDRVYNWPTLHTPESKTIQGAVEPLSIKVNRKHQYNILSQRIDREKKMFVIGQKIQTCKDLHDKNEKVKVSKETVNTSATYRFEAKRK